MNHGGGGGGAQEMRPRHLVTEKHGRWARLTNPLGAYFWVMSLLFQGWGEPGRAGAGVIVKAGNYLRDAERR